ncbi:hypothetical protein ACOJQI_11515 [Bacillus salacetis]|uniref:hypothetical protein n=1 Tax=Bacillus salacetis TaxID=2315464 RepID=UPI003BA0FBFC
MKKLLLFVLLILLMAACSNKPNSSSRAIEVSRSSGDYKVYESLEELETDSGLIIKGQLHGEPSIQKEYQNEVHIYSVRRSEVMIEEVFKGQVSEGETIIMYEPGYVQNDILETIEGYVPMSKSGNYILFLRKNPNGEFVVMGADQGKYNLKIKEKAKRNNEVTIEQLEKVDYIGDNPKRFNKLKDEVIEKYN